jgi:flagellar basal-body rod protein FlgF
MIYGLYHSAAGMLASEYRQNVIANNLANADTVGFKRDVPTFAERLTAVEEGLRDGPSAADLAGISGGLALGGTYTDHSVGPLMQTGNPTDVALEGPGFLTVQTDQGPLFTRDGRLMIDSNGLLVSAVDGAPVLGVGGAPLHVNPVGGRLSISNEGQVQQDGTTLGELQIVDFADYDQLRKVGTTRFDANGMQTVPSVALVRQSYVENSGVQPIGELVNMLDASHAYQMNARLVSLQDESLGRVINTLLK